MSTSRSATSFGALRASSLGLMTNDLSCKFPTPRRALVDEYLPLLLLLTLELDEQGPTASQPSGRTSNSSSASTPPTSPSRAPSGCSCATAGAVPTAARRRGRGRRAARAARRPRTAAAGARSTPSPKSTPRPARAGRTRAGARGAISPCSLGVGGRRTIGLIWRPRRRIRRWINLRRVEELIHPSRSFLAVTT